MGLAETLSPYISNLFPADAEIVDNGEHHMRISWRAPIEGRPNRQATPIAIHFDRDLVAAITSASEFEVATVIGPRFRNSLEMKLFDYEPNAGDLQAFVVYAGIESIGG